MTRLFLVSLCFSVLATTTAQNEKRFLVKAGEIPGNAIPAEEIYFFSSFTKGIATLKDGTKSTQQFNYNCLLDELQFLNAAGDTLAIAEPALLRKVEIDNVVYYFNKGYLRQVLKTEKFTLAVKERLFMADRKKEAAYGTKSGTSAIDNYSNIYKDGRAFRLESREDISFKKEQNLFIGNAYDHFFRADKKGFYDVFADKRTKMDDYIKKEKINFNNAEDVKTLFLFCTSN